MISSFVGIDYGSKTSGNTVICHHDGQVIHFYDADTKDADLFILARIAGNQSVLNGELTNETHIEAVFLDAPLSLPAVYHSRPGFSNYHYRQCDVALKAMSPLFLGGLTARAMELKHRLKEKANVETYEVYPKAIAQRLFPTEYHKKLSTAEMVNLSKSLTENFPVLRFDKYPKNQHQFDALLAWISGYRFMNQQHSVFGDAQEGLIIV
jgi:predicted nuclease with RNAse H fold